MPEKSAEELKARIKELEAQLKQSRKMEVIGTLASGVAHDLNNILSGIVSYPELILMDLPEDSPLKKPIAAIKQSGKKAAVIVQDLLTLARRGVPGASILNLNEIISEIKQSPEFHTLKRRYPDITVVFELEMPIHNIKGSSIHISKSIINLLYNAAEAIEGKGKITVATGNSEIETPSKVYNHTVKPGKYVTVSVRDTGAGISDEDISRIFEPFYTKKIMGRSGTGLGMPVVWGTISDHNGYINVVSMENRGTTFDLYFPVTEERRKQNKPDRDTATHKGNGESILVVDDIPEQREIATAILEKLGYNVASVSSGEKAVEYIEHNHIDLVILDMIMEPGMDGLDTFKEMTRIRPDQKVIIASGYSENDKVKEILSTGRGMYIKKPYSMADIGKAVKEELARK